MRPVVSDHDPREHTAKVGADETLCGAPVLIEIHHDGRLEQCRVCRALAKRRLCAHADRDGEGMHWLAPGERCPDEPARPTLRLVTDEG